MTESFAVQSSLTLKTNVNQVLSELIEGFERADEAVKGTQERLAALGNSVKELGSSKGVFKELFEGLDKLQNLRLGGTLLEELSKASEFSTSIAGAHQSMRSAAVETAAAWREIAAASKDVRMPAPPGPRGGGTGGNAGAGGEERGPRRSGMTDLRYDNDYKLAGQDNALHDLHNDNDRLLADQHNALVDRQKNNTRALADQTNALFERARENERLLAEQDNVLFDRKRDHDHILADQDNALFEIKQSHMHILADQENELFDRQRNNIHRLAELDNQRYDRQHDNTRRLADLDNEHYNTFGTPGQRQEASLIDADYSARMAAKRKQEKADEPDRMSHHDLLHVGVGMQMAGDAGASFFGGAFMADADYEHKFAVLTGDMRVTEQQQKELRETLSTVTRQVPGSTLGGNLEIFNDLKNTFGDFGEAKAELKSFSEMVTVLQMQDLHRGGEGGMGQALALARFLEDQGGAIDLKDPTKYDQGKFDEIAHKAVSIAIATQMRVTPREMLAFQKTGRTGGMMMDDHALYEETPYFAASLGASKLGTSIFSDVQVMLAGRMDKAHASELESLGLLGGGHSEGKGRNKRWVYDANSLKDRDELATDPYKWIHDILGGAVAKKLGVDPSTKPGEQAILLELTNAAQRGTIAGLWGDVYRNYGPAQKEGRNIAAQNPDMMGHFMKTDPMAQLMVFRAAENELMVTMGELLKGPAIEYLKQLTSVLHGMVDAMNKNPDAAAQIAKTVAEVAIAAKVLGSLAMVGFFAGPVLKGLSTTLSLFAGGGRALAGLVGLTAGIEGLAAKLGASAIVPSVVKKAVPAAAASAGAFGGLAAVLGVGAWAGFKGASMTGEDIYKHNQSGETPGMLNEFGQPLYYKAAPTQNLVSPPAADSKGTDANPVVVHVQNQTSGADIANGVGNNMARKLNNPQTGATGSDIRMGLSPAFLGGLAP